MFANLLFIIIFVCVLIIILEYVWLFMLASIRQRQNEFYNDSKSKISELYEAAYLSSNELNLNKILLNIKNYVGKNDVRMDIITEFIYDAITEDDGSNHNDKANYICSRIFFEINPNKFYTSILSKGNNYKKAFACKKLSQFNSDKVDNKLINLINTNNRELKYQVLISLSAIGNHDGLLKLFTDELDSNYLYSYRIIIEVLDIYTGDRLLLIKDIIEKCNDYIKGVVIKAAAKYKYSELCDVYIKNLTNKDVNIKIACINALGKLGDPKYEHELIIMANDKSWNVRAAAVKNLEYFNSKDTLNTLKNATTDSNWWVRNNAAESLVKIDENLEYSKDILNGYDRFAVESVKYALFRKFEV